MCEQLEINGTRVIVCGMRRQHRKCSVCHKETATRECDWKIGGSAHDPKAGAKTCDAPLCTFCSFSPAKDKDLCPAHHQAWEAWKQRRELPLFAEGA